MRRAPSASQNQLVDHLTGGRADTILVHELSGWLATSSRFERFATAHADKIRKKFRGATEPDARRDVRAELAVAHLLLADRRIELHYEAYGAAKGGPDFTATFRGGRAFNLEVTRLRRSPAEADGSSQILAKLRQLPPSVPNVVVLAIGGPTATALDVDRAIRSLRSRADRKGEAFFIDRGFASSRAFHERSLRLAAVITWSEDAGGDERASLWVNASARIRLAESTARACLACFRA
ncbi:MAG: hypothetical protein ACHQ3P_01345 [Candidatus Limnocylindrales bacterium]